MKVFIAEGQYGNYRIYSNIEAAIFNLTGAAGVHNYTVTHSIDDKKVYGTAAKRRIKSSSSAQFILHCYNEDASCITEKYIITEKEVITGDDAYSSPPAA